MPATTPSTERSRLRSGIGPLLIEFRSSALWLFAFGLRVAFRRCSRLIRLLDFHLFQRHRRCRGPGLGTAARTPQAAEALPAAFRHTEAELDAVPPGPPRPPHLLEEAQPDTPDQGIDTAGAEVAR